MTREDPFIWIAVGGVGAVALGVALIPFRSLTPASNLAFVFLVFTIVVAELGGRAAGLTTAVVSALSLNFMLTQPYLTLAIDKPDDVVAFVALTATGLVAAAFGRRRARSSELASRARHDLDALQRTGEGLATGHPLDDVLEELRRAFRLGGLVLRRADERLVAAAPPEQGSRPRPPVELEPRTLLAAGVRAHRLGRRGFRLPEQGGRLRLAADEERLSLDLWEGDQDGLSADEGQALAVAAAMIGLALRRHPGPGAQAT